LSDALLTFPLHSTLIALGVDAYRHYCWPVNSVADIKIAPFHLLASEGRAYVDETHVWHMETLTELCAADPEVLLATPFRTLRLSDAEATASLIDWWESLTSGGGEGMVVKPLDFIVRDPEKIPEGL
jgi:protein phosphatase